ncbi:hypothetical protein PIB19_07775 [Sphingomonas sp. 7/4-4]|uniref:hypothetical protein n=1 Tax=Sphingomonas sp. 7/4-4 TaxID=3018446 RepID=UPI0022F39A13|nr:hypothetical protein [Sphingomonas sp. 7/4-4]WBY09225.1 hypothetical protein PIB19_07775 [Sphingomonas sp. 7/4-4]
MAFLLAPIPAAFFQATVVAIWPKEGTGLYEHPLSMFVAICLVFYTFGLLLGLPLLWFLKERRMPSLRGYALGGAIITLLPTAVHLGWIAFLGGLTPYIAIYHIAFFGVGGAAAGAIFYVIAQRGSRRKVNMAP